MRGRRATGGMVVTTITPALIAVLAVAVAVAFLAVPSPAAADPGDHTVVSHPGGHMGPPRDLTSGPDGNIWVATYDDSVSRVSLGGTVTNTRLPQTAFALRSLERVTAGPDGQVWGLVGFSSWFGSTINAVWRVAPDGQVDEVAPSLDGILIDLVTGSDQGVWVSRAPRSIIRIDPRTGATQPVATPAGRAAPLELTRGGDGGVWFTTTPGRGQTPAIGRLDPTTRTFRYFRIGASPAGDLVWARGALWFTVPGRGRIGRLDPATGTLAFRDAGFPNPVSIVRSLGRLWYSAGGDETCAVPTVYCQYPGDPRLGHLDMGTGSVSVTTPLAGAGDVGRLAAAPDGSVWYVRPGTAALGRVDARGTATAIVDDDNSPNGPVGVAAGPRAAVWITSGGDDRIGRISPSGRYTMYADAEHEVDAPQGITAGPDGSMWFASARNDRIGRIDPTTGAITTIADPAGKVDRPTDLVTGPDGDVWFTSRNNNRIGRLDPATGTIETLRNPEVDRPTGITIGPDGAPWFRSSGNQRVGRIDVETGTITTLPTPIPPPAPGATLDTGIATGPDGALWLPSRGTRRIGRLALDGSYSEVALPPDDGARPVDVAAGPDQAMWVSRTGGTIVRITMALRTTTFGSGADLGAITVGSDGSLWATRPRWGSVVRHEPGGWPAAGYEDVPAEPDIEAADWARFYGLVEARLQCVGGPRTAICEEYLDPETELSRLAAVRALWVLAGRPAETRPAAYADLPYDLDEDGHTSVRWATAAGIVGPDPDGNLRPQETVTHEALAAMLQTMLGPSFPELTAGGAAPITRLAAITALHGLAGDPSAWASWAGPLPPPVWWE
ncbi:MAG: SMP-30/gluconolactonase/LRE family protein [Acidimicrobiales bacterium]|nr:SMP-30/gluconolactonase/LRE family protein [Acidimicrobiales bacterium]